ncbi:MAG: rhodanese-like domain-containing protein [Acidobacteriaceae bacterium]
MPPNERRSLMARISGPGHTLSPPSLDGLSVETIPGEKPFPVKAAQETTEELDDRSVFALGSTRKVIDVREREFFHNPQIRNEMNIPFAELNVRARIELNPKTPTVVDCSQTDVGLCDLAAAVLVSLKFDSVSVLDRGARGIACKITPTR